MQKKRSWIEVEIEFEVEIEKIPRYLGMTVCKYIVKRILNDVEILETRN